MFAFCWEIFTRSQNLDLVKWPHLRTHKFTFGPRTWIYEEIHHLPKRMVVIYISSLFVSPNR